LIIYIFANMTTRPIKDFDDYHIDELGTVYNRHGRPLKHQTLWNGKAGVFLRKERKTYCRTVEKLIKTHFTEL